jgi:hypothetical protein
MYVEMQVNYNNLAPVVTIPPAYFSKWYVTTRFEVPRGSIDGRDYVEVATAQTESNADLIVYRYKFSIPFIEVDSARRAGVPIWSQNIAVALKQMDMQIAHLWFEGTHSWDPVAINGLRDGGTDHNDATLDGKAWDTVTHPHFYAADAWAALNTAGFTGPYTWALSANLGPGMRAKYGAGDPSHDTLIRQQYDIDQIAYLPIGTSTRNRIYPIAPAATDQGVSFMYKKDSSVARIAETGPPKLKIVPEINDETNAFEGWLQWHGTVQIVQATGIQYNEDIDLVT